MNFPAVMDKPSSRVALVETPTACAAVALSGEGIIHSDAPPTCTIAVTSNTLHIPSPSRVKDVLERFTTGWGSMSEQYNTRRARRTGAEGKSCIGTSPAWSFSTIRNGHPRVTLVIYYIINTNLGHAQNFAK